MLSAGNAGDPGLIPGKIPWRRNRLPTLVFLGYLGGSDGKESACKAGDLGLVPGLEWPPGEGHDNPFQYFCLENPHGQRCLVGYSPQGHEELDTTEQLSFLSMLLIGHPWWLSGKESTCNAGDTETQVLSLGGEDPLEKEMATHSSIISSGKTCGQRSLVGYNSWGCKELDMTEWLNNNVIQGKWDISGHFEKDWLQL